MNEKIIGKDASLKEREDKRMHFLLDAMNFEKLKLIKEKHGDVSYTQSLKRAIVLQRFIDEQMEDGGELVVLSPDGKQSKIKIGG